MTQLTAQVCDHWGASHAILNCLYGVQLIFNEDIARAFASALNDWIAKEWLDRDPRLRASIVIPIQNVEYAVDEIERCAKDRRFVQILVLAMQETPLGRRHHWPIFAAAERHRAADRHSCGLELSQSGDLARLADVLRRGVHQPSPRLSDPGREPDHRGRVRQVSEAEGRADRIRVHLVAWASFGASRNSGAARAPKCRGSIARPSEIVRDHFRLTLQPFDGPSDPDDVERIIDHLRSDDMLLFSSDFPHWQFDGDERLPKGIPQGLRRKILVENPLATYDRLNSSPAPESRP